MRRSKSSAVGPVSTGSRAATRRPATFRGRMLSLLVVLICQNTPFRPVTMTARLQGAEVLVTPHNNEIGAGAADNDQIRIDRDATPAGPGTQVGQMRTNSRRPTNAVDLRAWLENMVVFHRFTPVEVKAATGLTFEEIAAALRQFDLAGKTPPPRAPGDPLRLLPYPGGRHPRIGFLEGAVMPQRETKVSVFTPWDDASYVVVDVPEAIFSNLGLTYLAHTHIPTLWDLQQVTLPRLEWTRHAEGVLTSERTLPNGIAFGARATPTPTEVRMDLWLRNGTAQPLTGLRVQNCVMLAGARGFSAQTATNKVFQSPYAAARATESPRWVITAWEPVQRCWGNEQCPCLHSDPQFPDCAPDATVRVRGWLSFYEGPDLPAELQRIEQTGWRKPPNPASEPARTRP